MPSDPLPLSPETQSGKLLVEWARGSTMSAFVTLSPAERGLVVQSVIVAASRIEQEARTLARAEVIAEAIEAAQPVPYPYRAPLVAALSRLGERE